ncbi:MULTISPECIES: 2-amino-4-hydroxy-6-hydroxymethyldihydropteridine diphosphokinase [Vitreoscilla]|uniref:2-amino-4-hydroxy-6-hydroxymethyldihydropteridine pyrophosphokinase n=1 Tax=Vitreoscilla stercoraria TaxID=61 RepID=A0ABY4E936_VITST|nr:MULTISPECIES: 2-amino-4-hydroxy-6-hydroxymethyldihydropteridine diphosphokinase [Vitreoscilla]AUZ04420.1 2-amino-4-hydroxy-6- hydroxymethyldihydropteridine diphosphokinase [Vitreoscilla sp. C1]UOO91858.1 2-amino-4-hydroxy-6-hydroxymethyldihydropteridine diphosphokinase [Vitreoscilla stercoraria]
MLKYTALIALGSNLSEPVAQVQRAIDCLKKHNAIDIIASSRLYRTAPVGYLDQPDFINAAVQIETTLEPMLLLQLLNQVEADFGRERTFQNAPRTLDLDIIDYAGQIWNTERLTLPHPRAHERGFVLMPLHDIVPNVYLGEKGSVADLLAQVDVSDIECLHDVM